VRKTQRYLGLLLVLLAAIAIVLVLLGVLAATNVIFYAAIVVGIIGLVLVWTSGKRGTP
jgi:hypothetical protein